MKNAFAILLVLIAVPALIVGGMWGLAWVSQPSPGAGSLTVTTTRSLIWPWQKVEAQVNANLSQPGKQVLKKGLTDVVLLVDRSSSMGRGPGSPLEAAVSAVRNFIATVVAHQVRVGVVAFESRPRMIHPLSDEPISLLASLSQFERTGGGTHIAGALGAARDVLNNPPPTSRPIDHKAVILLTDGEDHSQDAAFQRAAELRADGAVIFTIGLGHSARSDFLKKIASSPDYYSHTLDPNSLSLIFQNYAGQLAEAIGRSALVTEQVNLALFEIPQENSKLPFLTQMDPAGGLLEWKRPFLFAGPRVVYYHLEPRLAGLLSLGKERTRLTYLDTSGSPKQLQGAQKPKVAVITWLLLILLAAPALLYLLWLIYRWLVWKLRKEEPEPKKDPVPAPHAPPVLKSLPSPALWKARPIPTLFIGLGGTGRVALTHLKHTCRETFGPENGGAIRLLCLDVAESEYYGNQALDVALDQVKLSDDEICLIGGVLESQLKEIEDDPQRGDHLKGMEPSLYQGLPAQVKEMYTGSNGWRGLARLTLVNDLGKGSDSKVCQALKESLASLAVTSGGEGIQVFILGSPQGGVGSGFLPEIGWLAGSLGRQARTRPEEPLTVNSVLLSRSGAGAKGDANFLALATELGRLAQAGTYPVVFEYGAGPEKSPAGMLRWPVFSRQFYFSQEAMQIRRGDPLQTMCASAAEFLLLNCEAGGRRGMQEYQLAYEAHLASQAKSKMALRSRIVTAASAASWRVPLPEWIEILKHKTVRHLLGGGMLLDLQEAEQDGGLPFYPGPLKNDLEDIVKTWKEKKYIEQRMHPLGRLLVDYCIDGTSPIKDGLKAEAARPESLEVHRRELIETHGDFLQLVLNEVLIVPIRQDGGVQEARSGRLGLAYHLVLLLDRKLRELTPAVVQEAGSKMGPKQVERLEALLETLGRIHLDLVAELEDWTLTLIDNRIIPEPLGVDSREEEGLFQFSNRRLRELKSFLEEDLAGLGLRRYLGPDDGDPELDLGLLFEAIREQWLETEEGLLAGMWFEAGAGAPRGLSPSLRLVLAGRNRRENIGLGPDAAQRIYETVGAVCERVLAPTYLSTIFSKLHRQAEDEAVGRDVKPPNEVADWLKEVSLTLRTGEADRYGATPFSHLMLAHPSPELFRHLPSSKDYFHRFQDAAKDRLPEEWSRLDSANGNRFALGACLLVDALPLQILSEYRRAEGSWAGSKWREGLECLYEPENRLLKIYPRHLMNLTGQNLPPFDPLLGALVGDHSLLLCFSLLRACDRLRREERALEPQYICTMPNGSDRILSPHDPDPDLFTAAMGLAGLDQSPSGITIELRNQEPDLAEKIAGYMGVLEDRVRDNLAQPGGLGLDDQVEMLVLVELFLETERNRILP